MILKTINYVVIKLHYGSYIPNDFHLHQLG